MDCRTTNESCERFTDYIDGLASVIGPSNRADPLRDYCTGLLLPAARKSVEPMAAITDPSRTAAQHQCLLHFVGNSPWSDGKVMEKIRDTVVPKIEAHGPVTAWIFDDTGFPKKGKHSVGVARQYCGQLGKQDNCQVAVSMSIANRHASLPVAYQLYLPKDWAGDPVRRKKAGVPDEITFKTKPEIALDQLKWACEADLPRGIVLMDAGYGVNTELRQGITALGLRYAVGVSPNATVWTAGTAALPPKPSTGRGRPAVRPRRDEQHQPTAIDKLALGLPQDDWHSIEWREGTNTPLKSRFARVRVRCAHDPDIPTDDIPWEWLVIEWPDDEAEPTKYWFSTLDETISFIDLVDAIKQRWRIERDYLELKQEIGLGHFEGRGWRGFHHHATLCIAAYGFLVMEKAAFPPSETRRQLFRAQPAIPENYRPRGAATAH